MLAIYPDMFETHEQSVPTNIYTSNYLSNSTVQYRTHSNATTQTEQNSSDQPVSENGANSRVALRFSSDKLYICLIGEYAIGE